jgi:hypothetical protein
VEHSEVKSENARNVILTYNDTVYFVKSVKVQIEEGVGKFKAVFHAKRASDETPQDLDIEINQGTYDILLEYARLDKLNLIMVLQIEGGSSKWCIMSEDWLNSRRPKIGNAGYVV